MSAASQLKDEGNAHFRAGRFWDAVKSYRKAEEASPDDPVFTSNLSAAFFELGQYAQCQETISRCFEKIEKSKGNSDLYERLSKRRTKAFEYGITGGSIALASLPNDVSLPHLNGKSSDAEGARQRLADLPLFKMAP
ncbi:hypothetical protein C8J56DRAFT_1169940 [Mycena floridula]|nr:hypothetical protein C8J56DRAFT_1169940 [Mycena floridula]